MTSIKDIPIADIKLFLEKNNIHFNKNAAYDEAWKLLKKGTDFTTYGNNIIAWLKAYNLLRSKANIKEYSERDINKMSINDKESLAKLLNLHPDETLYIVTVLKYMSKLKKDEINKICDEDVILRAIDHYGKRIMRIPIIQLEREYGSNAFNSEYLEDSWDNLRITRRGFDIDLQGIVGHALRSHDFDMAEKEANYGPALMDERFGDGWRPNWNPSWNYTKCLLRILQANPRTRDDFHNMISDERLWT